MKRIVSRLGFAALAVVVLATCVCLFTPAATRCDLHFRLAEVDCVRQSIDPYRVWNEEVVVRPYYSNNPAAKSVPDGCNEMISVYVPWEYALMLPLSFLGKNCAWWTYSILSLFLLLGAIAMMLHLQRSRDNGFDDAALLVVTPTLLVSHAIWSNFQVGNYAVMVLVFALLMAQFLNCGKSIPAGLCWSLIMVKPQIGLVFAIPLMMRMRIASCIVATCACLALSVYPIIQCHASLIDLLIEPSQASAFAFEGCGTWPKMLCGILPGNVDILVGTIIGVVVCIVMTWLVRKEKDWFVFLMPAAITSCCWTYTQAYSHIMGWFVAFVLVRELLRNPNSKFLWVLVVLAAFSLTRWFLAWHGLVAFMGWRFPMSEYVFRCVDSLNSTLSLALAFVLCLKIGRSHRMTNEMAL